MCMCYIFNMYERLKTKYKNILHMYVCHPGKQGIQIFGTFTKENLKNMKHIKMKKQKKFHENHKKISSFNRKRLKRLHSLEHWIDLYFSNKISCLCIFVQFFCYSKLGPFTANLNYMPKLYILIPSCAYPMEPIFLFTISIFFICVYAQT